MPSSSGSGLQAGTVDVQALVAAATAAALASGTSGQLNPALLGNIAGQGSAIAFLLTDQMRVLQKMQARFGRTDALVVNLMHNASAQHALPSLLSGERNSMYPVL